MQLIPGVVVVDALSGFVPIRSPKPQVPTKLSKIQTYRGMRNPRWVELYDPTVPSHYEHRFETMADCQKFFADFGITLGKDDLDYYADTGELLKGYRVVVAPKNRDATETPPPTQFEVRGSQPVPDRLTKCIAELRALKREGLFSLASDQDIADALNAKRYTNTGGQSDQWSASIVSKRF